MTARIPSPNACQHCGVDEREHMQRWKPPVGWHKWTPPTNDQIKARMRARRAARLDAPAPQYHAATGEHLEWSYASDTPMPSEYCADCGDPECTRWMRIQDRLEGERWARTQAQWARAAANAAEQPR